MANPKVVNVCNLTGRDLAISVCIYDGFNICISKTIEASNHSSAEIVKAKAMFDGTPLMQWQKVKVVRG